MTSLKYIVLLMAMLHSAEGVKAQTYIGAGNNEGITISSSSDLDGTAATYTMDGSGLDAQKMEASRFLRQATMGYNMAEVDTVVSIGFESWLAHQIDMSASQLTPQMKTNWDSLFKWAIQTYTDRYLEANPGAEITEELLEEFDDDIFGPWGVDFHYAWWENTILSDDQLRQRMAFALSQVLVVSLRSSLIDHAVSLTSYYDIFLRHAFGNYRDILEEVTLHPSMGLYLSHYNNPREIPSENLHPDENYAREIMQLFSIGLYELNNDGSRKVDVDGNYIPTYNNNDIKELATVFTGLGAGGVMENPWVAQPFFGMDWYLADKEMPMQMFQIWHEPSEKIILGDLVLPADQPGMQDVEQTLDYLFEHPNVGPFLCRQLIQRFIKSNPTPGYIDRVASVFNNNGEGVRGDLGAVIKAIFLDEEARSCADLESSENGQLIEPLLRITGIARFLELECRKDTSYMVGGEMIEEEINCNEPRYWMNGFDENRALRQSPLGAASVFNFYLPDHQPVGDFTSLGLVGPEFKIHDSSTSINYINRLHSTFFWNLLGSSWENEFNEDLGWLSVNTASIEDLVETPEALFNHLDILVTRGGLTDQTRSFLRETIEEMPNWVDNEDRTQLILYLMMLSPDYTILK